MLRIHVWISDLISILLNVFTEILMLHLVFWTSNISALIHYGNQVSSYELNFTFHHTFYTDWLSRYTRRVLDHGVEGSTRRRGKKEALSMFTDMMMIHAAMLCIGDRHSTLHTLPPSPPSPQPSQPAQPPPPQTPRPLQNAYSNANKMF